MEEVVSLAHRHRTSDRTVIVGLSTVSIALVLHFLEKFTIPPVPCNIDLGAPVANGSRLWVGLDRPATTNPYPRYATGRHDVPKGCEDSFVKDGRHNETPCNGFKQKDSVTIKS